MIVIIGAGPAGLSCAVRLKELGKDAAIFEKESRPGGLIRTEKFGAYQFDYGGHLLHFRRPEMEKWVKGLMGKDRLIRIKRKSFVFSSRVLTPYPFQVNTFGLPAEVIRDCLLGFIEVNCLAGPAKTKNFHDWILAHFGEGFARHFLFPFNRKFWRIPLTELDSEWAEWSVPRPAIKDVVEGALGLTREDYGYNAWFHYPRKGGVETLARSLAEQLQKISLNRAIISLNLKNRKILLDNGEEIVYHKLVSTMPLRELINKAKDMPAKLKTAGQGLRHISVLCINLGIKGPPLSPAHWIYFPEDRFMFYRAGFYGNFSDKPSEYQSVVLEFTYLPDQEPLDEQTLIKQAIKDFKKTGLLTDAHEIEYTGAMKIPCAYVIFDRRRKQVLPGMLKYLEDHGVYSIGRYGGWTYSTIEDALKEGMETAEKLAQ